MESTIEYNQPSVRLRRGSFVIFGCGYKFDIIVDDISGISEEVAKLSKWFENVPCNAGIDGTANIEEVLN